MSKLQDKLNANYKAASLFHKNITYHFKLPPTANQNFIWSHFHQSFALHTERTLESFRTSANLNMDRLLLPLLSDFMNLK